MSTVRYFTYDTKPEVRAFLEGVEYVNDSALEVRGVFWIPPAVIRDADGKGCFVVRITDSDKPEGESEDAPEGFDSPLTQAIGVD